MDLQQLYTLLKEGGPIAMAAIFAFMWWLERQGAQAARDRQAALEDRILELAVAQTAAVSKLDPALSNLKEILTQILNRL